jgi:hypothetical protein
MKGQVSILLLVALVYIVETVLAPSKMLSDQQKMLSDMQASLYYSNKASQKNNCTYCNHSGHSRGTPLKTCQGDCTNTANCTNCPLCYAATLSPFYYLPAMNVINRTVYPSIPGKRISGYVSRSWKPPDVLL